MTPNQCMTRQSEAGATKCGAADFQFRLRHDLKAISCLITFCISMIALAIMQNSQCGLSPTIYGIHPYLVDWMGSAKYYIWQMRGYEVLIGLGATFVLCAPVLLNRLTAIVDAHGAAINRLTMVVAVTALAARLFQNPSGFITGALCALPVVALLRRPVAFSRVACQFLLLGFVAILVLPGLFATPDLTTLSPDKFIEIQTHFSDLVAPATLLSQGKLLFREVNPDYGVIQPVCLAAIKNITGAKFSFGTEVEFIRGFQSMFILLAAWLFYRAAGNAKIASLFAIAFFAPFLQINQMSEYFPNQTAWRLFGFPLAVLTLFLVRSASLPVVSYTLGCLAAFLLLFNLETGICSTFGFMAFLYMRAGATQTSRIVALTKTVLMFVAGLLISFSCLYGLGWLLLGYAPDLPALLDLVSAQQVLVASGYLGGGRLEFQPVPLLIVVHCLYCAIRISLQSTFPTSHRNSVRMAISVMCLLWFTYYINQSQGGDQYLVACYFLYSFLLIDMVRAAIIGLRRKTSVVVEPAIVTCAVLCLLIVPRIGQQLKSADTVFKATAHELMYGPANPSALLLSGVYVNADLEKELVQKAAFVKEKSNSGPVYYLTASSFIIPILSGVSSAAPVNDIFSGLVFEKDTDRLIEQLRSRPDAATIFVDTENALLGGEQPWRDCFADLRKRLSQYYRETSATSGWEIWSKKPL